eukprot:COSAG06_NODE_93_length_24652_cov_1832.353399_10_plen_560_part_00
MTVDHYLDPHFKIDGTKHQAMDARHYMNRYGQVPGSAAMGPVAASNCNTKNEHGLSRYTVALVTKCIRCARLCLFKDMHRWRAKFHGLSKEVQKQMFGIYSHHFVCPPGHAWRSDMCDHLHLLLCDQCKPVECDSVLPTTCIYCDGGCSLLNVCEEPLDMPLDMGKLEKWLLHFLDRNPFHQKEFVDRPLGLPLLLDQDLVLKLPIKYVGHLESCRCGTCETQRRIKLIEANRAEYDRCKESHNAELKAWSSVSASMETVTSGVPPVVTNGFFRDAYEEDGMDVKCPDMSSAEQLLGVNCKLTSLTGLSFEERRLMHTARGRLPATFSWKAGDFTYHDEPDLEICRLEVRLTELPTDNLTMFTQKDLVNWLDNAKRCLQCPVVHQREKTLLRQFGQYLTLRHGCDIENFSKFHNVCIGVSAMSPGLPVNTVACNIAYGTQHYYMMQRSAFDRKQWLDAQTVGAVRGMTVMQFFQTHSMVDDDHAAKCAASQEARDEHAVEAAKARCLVHRLREYLRALSVLDWFRLGRQLGLQEDALLAETRDINAMLRAMSAAEAGGI